MGRTGSEPPATWQGAPPAGHLGLICVARWAREKEGEERDPEPGGFVRSGEQRFVRVERAGKCIKCSCAFSLVCLTASAAAASDLTLVFAARGAEGSIPTTRGRRAQLTAEQLAQERVATALARQQQFYGLRNLNVFNNVMDTEARTGMGGPTDDFT